jgi:hypothetical protein
VARLHHVILPSNDHMHTAEFLGLLLGIEPSPIAEHFPRSPSLTIGDLRLMFCRGPLVYHHLAFHVSAAEFDGIIQRIREHGIPHGDAPVRINNSRVRTDDRGNGYRAVWLRSPDAMLLEFFSFDELPEGYTDPATMPLTTVT